MGAGLTWGDSNVNSVLQPAGRLPPEKCTVGTFSGRLCSNCQKTRKRVLVERNCSSEQLQTYIPSGTLTQIGVAGNLAPSLLRLWFRLPGVGDRRVPADMMSRARRGAYVGALVSE
jgi:hypothetical protein